MEDFGTLEELFKRMKVLSVGIQEYREQIAVKKAEKQTCEKELKTALAEAQKAYGTSDVNQLVVLYKQKANQVNVACKKAEDVLAQVKVGFLNANFI